MRIPVTSIFSLLCAELEWRAEHLSALEPTPLGAAIFFKLSDSFSQNKPIRLKELYARLPHAHSAIRKNINRMVEANYIALLPVPSDSRAKVIVPLPHFHDLIRQYLDLVERYTPEVCRSSCGHELPSYSYGMVHH